MTNMLICNAVLLAAVAIVTQAASVATATDLLPEICLVPQATCDLNLLQQGQHNPNMTHALSGTCDTTAIAKEYVAQKDNLESFILQFIGNFNTVQPGKTMDASAAWLSTVGKMSILWGPLLQAPYYDTDVDESDLKNYTEKLYSVMQGTDSTPCATKAYGQSDGIPYAIGFPLDPTYNLFVSSEPSEVRSTWWTMDYVRTPMYAQ
eukprot:Clim_evm5s76 gene=Clim_evmTU5s76